jgi:hypothetical protein
LQYWNVATPIFCKFAAQVTCAAEGFQRLMVAAVMTVQKVRTKHTNKSSVNVNL